MTEHCPPSSKARLAPFAVLAMISILGCTKKRTEDATAPDVAPSGDQRPKESARAENFDRSGDDAAPSNEKTAPSQAGPRAVSTAETGAAAFVRESESLFEEIRTSMVPSKTGDALGEFAGEEVYPAVPADGKRDASDKVRVLTTAFAPGVSACVVRSYGHYFENGQYGVPVDHDEYERLYQVADKPLQQVGSGSLVRVVGEMYEISDAFDYGEKAVPAEWTVENLAGSWRIIRRKVGNRVCE